MTDELTGRGPVSVLCVDRDAPDRTASRLDAHGSFETTTATSVAAARDRLDDTPVDCVVTDTPLVDGDAFDLLAALRADHPSLPVILFPANGSEALASDAVGAGVADYVRDAGDDAAATLAARVRSAARARETSESAERARLLLEASPDAIVVSVDGRYVYANPAAVDLFDADGPGDVVGLRPTDVVHPDEREAVGDALERAAPGEHTVDQVHRRLRTLTGDTLDVEITGRATVWNGRRAVVAIIRDVTERVRLESDLREQNERLQRFASAVSHDIRTPVATAQGNLDVARDRRDWDRLDRVEESLEHVERTVDDLLSLARESRDGDAVESVDLASAAREAWRVVAADRSDATLVVADDVDTVAADPRLLRQLLENVLANAVEHGGDDVTVRVDATDDGFAISDDGPGVPAAERERVFERGVTTNADGTGLGLAIVADIAAAHDWTLDLTESQRGGLRLAVALA